MQRRLPPRATVEDYFVGGQHQLGVVEEADGAGWYVLQPRSRAEEWVFLTPVNSYGTILSRITLFEQTGHRSKYFGLYLAGCRQCFSMLSA
jgi:hypothetical protein